LFVHFFVVFRCSTTDDEGWRVVTTSRYTVEIGSGRLLKIGGGVFDFRVVQFELIFDDYKTVCMSSYRRSECLFGNVV
jgi:hypothetical protein